MGTIWRQPAAGHDHVHVRVQNQRLPQDCRTYATSLFGYQERKKVPLVRSMTALIFFAASRGHNPSTSTVASALEYERAEQSPAENDYREPLDKAHARYSLPEHDTGLPSCKLLNRHLHFRARRRGE